MEKKKEFEEPQLKVIHYEAEDIIITSGSTQCYRGSSIASGTEGV